MMRIVEIVAVLVAGPLLGVEFAVAAFVNPMLGRLPDDAFGIARSSGSRLLGLVMPFWYLATLALLIATAALSYSSLVVASTVVLVAALLLTVTTLVPINSQIGRWEPGSAAPRQLAARWDRLHWVRVAALAVMFTLLVVAVISPA